MVVLVSTLPLVLALDVVDVVAPDVVVAALLLSALLDLGFLDERDFQILSEKILVVVIENDSEVEDFDEETGDEGVWQVPVFGVLVESDESGSLFLGGEVLLEFGGELFVKVLLEVGADEDFLILDFGADGGEFV